MNRNSPAYRTGYAVTYHIGRCFHPLLAVPVIGMPLYLAIGCLVVLALLPVGIAIGLWFWMAGNGRSAADPDKETPPHDWPGYPLPPTVERKPAEGPAERYPEPCCYCAGDLNARDTFWMDIDGSRVAHLRCREAAQRSERRHIDVEA